MVRNISTKKILFLPWLIIKWEPICRGKILKQSCLFWQERLLPAFWQATEITSGLLRRLVLPWHGDLHLCLTSCNTTQNADKFTFPCLPLFTEAMTSWIRQHILWRGATQEQCTGAHSAPLYRGSIKGPWSSWSLWSPSFLLAPVYILCSDILKFFSFLEGVILYPSSRLSHAVCSALNTFCVLANSTHPEIPA